ncbi:MAG: PilZ domain-containing protein [Planctomycetota bacterium]|jgi:c-di-GMP-binding flagellar brake protein YcgR
MRVERRAQYRVQTDDSKGLQLTLVGPDDTPFPGQLLDVSASGAGARFSAPNCPSLAVGQEAALLLTSVPLRISLTISSRVQSRTEEDESRRYGFRFLEGQQLDARVAPALRTLFNRRGAVRVCPDPKSPVKVVLDSGPGSPPTEGWLENISATGARIRLEADAESTFVWTTSVGLSLFLPDCGDPLQLTGNIRHRQLVGGGIHYGLEFDSQLTDNFPRQQEAIVKYVMQRQRVVLQTSAR